MTHRTLWVAAKWIWVLVLAVAIAHFLQRSWPKLREGLSHMEPLLIVASVLLTAGAKFALGENARLAAHKCGIGLGYPAALRLYNLSQLGKYLPGSIWQFVGRAAAYRNRGAGLSSIRDSLLIESLWVVISALLTGVALVGGRSLGLLHASASPLVGYWLAFVGVVGLAILAVALMWRRQSLARYLALLRPTPGLVLIMMAVWLLLGVAFWSLTSAAHMEVGVLYATGLFALAFALGFLVPIAPAGLGIRDGILTLGLLPFGTMGQVLAVTVIARLVYLVVEIGIVVIQETAIALHMRLQTQAD